MRYSDRIILEVIRGQDEKSINKLLKSLYKQYFPMAMAIVKQYGGNEDDVPDIFQESLVAFYENIKHRKFRGESTLNTYLYSTIKNIWFARLKKNKKYLVLENNEFTNLKADNDVPYSTKEDISMLLTSILDELGGSCQDLLKHYYYENCSMKDLATLMSFSSEDSAKSQKYKCMQKLIKLLNSKPELKKQICDLL